MDSYYALHFFGLLSGESSVDTILTTFEIFCHVPYPVCRSSQYLQPNIMEIVTRLEIFGEIETKSVSTLKFLAKLLNKHWRLHFNQD